MIFLFLIKITFFWRKNSNYPGDFEFSSKFNFRIYVICDFLTVCLQFFSWNQSGQNQIRTEPLKFNDFFLQEKPPLGDFESISNFLLKSDKHIHNDNNI